jgi:hypothetical protein
MMTPDAKRKLLWSLGFLEPDERKKIFDRIVELESEWRSNKTNLYAIGSLFEWIETREGGTFWYKMHQQQGDFIYGKIFCPHPTIIEIDDV